MLRTRKDTAGSAPVGSQRDVQDDADDDDIPENVLGDLIV
jgi:hypothetical protein